MADRIIRLSDVQNPVAGKFEIGDGSVHDIIKASGAQYQAFQSFDASTPVMTLWDLAAEVAPTIPRATLDTYDKDVIEIILKIASQGIEAVEKLFPNAESPERPTSPG